MSYNIDNWKTKKLDGLIIPLSELYTSLREGLQPGKPEIDRKNPELVRIYLCELGEISGRISGGDIIVTELTMGGEGSGTIYSKVLLPVLEKSKGSVEAVMVWEGGDSITRLRVNDGHIIEEPVEL